MEVRVIGASTFLVNKVNNKSPSIHFPFSRSSIKDKPVNVSDIKHTVLVHPTDLNKTFSNL